MKQTTKKIIAREFIWLLSLAVVSIVLWLLFEITVNEIGYSGSELAAIWDKFEITLIVIWSLSFPLRYIYLMTKWSVKTVNSDITDSVE